MRLRAAVGDLRPLGPNAAGVRRQHPHDRSLPPRRGDPRRRPRGLPDRPRGDPRDGAQRRRLRDPDVLQAAAAARAHRRWCHRSSVRPWSTPSPSAATTSLVYSDGSDALLGALRERASRAGVYAMRDGPSEDQVDGAITFRPRSVDGFLADLASCRGVIAGGGFSLISEAVYLGKPMMCSPLRGQFEQLMNARYLEREGYGICAQTMDERSLERFLERLDEIHERLEAYEQHGNREALDGDRDTGDGAGADSRRDRVRARRTARGQAAMNSRRRGRRSPARPRRPPRRGHGGLRRPVPDRADLRRDDPPRARGRQADRADLRRRPQPRADATAAGAARPLRREGDVLPDRRVGRARAGADPPDGRGRPRDRQPHLHAPDDAGPRRAADPRRAAALPRGGRGLGRALLDRGRRTR